VRAAQQWDAKDLAARITADRRDQSGQPDLSATTIEGESTR
jgi:hypothetical protein